MSDYATNKIYNHPDSRAARVKERRTVKPGEVAMVKTRHRGEVQELANRHRAAHARLEADRNRSMSRSGGATQDYSDANIAQKGTPRDKLNAKHADERSALAARHSRELSDAKNRNPVA
jgi:hypothetical protein